MIVVNCIQGSDEWHQARSGVITASMFSTARKRLKSGANKGDFSEAGKNYAFRIAIERAGGKLLDEGFETYHMRRGHELEEKARIAHEIQTGMLVDTAGFIKSDCGWFGASADGLIDHDGGAEYKCFVDPEKLRSILLDGNLEDVMDQIQGCMWIADRKWWHFGLYCPALEEINLDFTLKHVVRSDEYIAELEKDLKDFQSLVMQYELILRTQATQRSEAA